MLSKIKISNIRILFVVALTACITTLSAFVPANTPDAMLGTWLTGSKKGHVQIYKQGNQYYGKIVWLKEPIDPKTNQPKTDVNNPDSKKKEQPLLGLVNLRGFTYEGGNVWEEGKIYDPENGKEYSCKITLRDKNTLDVRGYIGISLIGRTDTWVRVK
ncbi:MAG: DUF2147 domain-containing protein [Bacteroidetes bacterium]|nr:DUF2147 domain-containing protein [Bacteroidota bacterium]